MSDEAHTTRNYCLNCGEELNGRYCYKCGQDSQVHQDTVWHLLRHFFEDITHYDGKFWKTVKPLLIKPGYLTREYLQGRRASYLNPVRMFIFLNFLFFLLLLSLPSNSYKGQRKQIALGAKSDLQTDKNVDSIINIKYGDVSLKSTGGVSTSAGYDSFQKTLPVEKRDSRIKHMINDKGLNLLEGMKKDPDYVTQKVGETFLHNAARLTFVFLVVCSALLWLLYFRQGIWMVNHALFSIHMACTFLLLATLMLLVNYLPLGDYLLLIIFLYGNYYFYKALRNVYQQSRGKTFVKFLIINLMLGITMSVALIINGVLALMYV